MLKKREEMSEEFTWNMSDLISGEETFLQLFDQTQKRLEGYEKFKGRLAESADTLCKCLEFDDEISREIELLYVYAKQKSDEDTGNQRYQDLAARALSLSNQGTMLSSYIVPEILSIDEVVLKQFTESGLGRFNRVISLILAKKQHTLSPEMEELLAQSHEATQSPSQIFNMFNNADIRFPSIMDSEGNMVPITHGNFISLMESSDRRVREAAFKGLYGSYGQFKNTLAAAFSANVKQAAFYAKARHYLSSRAYMLAENEIPEAVYDNLIEAVHNRLSLLHRYTALRKKALGVTELHMYDLYVPMVSEADRHFTYEEAKKAVTEGLAPLGERYLSLLNEGFDSRWIDVYENEGKRSGAYSWGAYGIHPYVLLNYNGTLDHVFTLAHEMGHALHSWFSDHSQPFTYAGYKIFVAEVASTCNEALLIRHMLNQATKPAQKCYLINHFLESFRGTLFRQTMFAEFEAVVHKKQEAGETLTAQVLCSMYRKLNEEYFGSEMTVDEEIDLEWARIPHFYTPFYVYQYATGFSAAIAISSRILAGDSKVLEGYFQFLNGGCSMPPIELLKLCGVDMSTAAPVYAALDVFEQLLDEIEPLL